MKRSAILFCVLFIFGFGINNSLAQAPCQSYACYLCLWGPPLKFEIPNIFSPNGDRVNDYWLPKINNQACLDEYDLIVFNKEGQLVFETNVFDVPWDGKNAEIGAYFFILNYSDFGTHKSYTQKGILYVIR